MNCVYTIMVMKKFSEPSSPNPNDEIGDNHNDNYINGKIIIYNNFFV